MIFQGISKVFSLKNEEQYNTIGALLYEIESFFENGKCQIDYYREAKK